MSCINPARAGAIYPYTQKYNSFRNQRSMALHDLMLVLEGGNNSLNYNSSRSDNCMLLFLDTFFKRWHHVGVNNIT